MTYFIMPNWLFYILATLIVHGVFWLFLVVGAGIYDGHFFSQKQYIL